MTLPVAVQARVATARARLAFGDHLIRAFQRYQDSAGDRLAASVTFFGFLSFFPLLALAAAVLSFRLGDAAVATIVSQVNDYAPGLADQLGLTALLTDNRTAGTAGLVGLVGLLYAGLGWVDALRQAVRVMWHHDVQGGNLVVRKAWDVLNLAGLGLMLLGSVALSGLGSAVSGPLAHVVAVGLGLLTSTLLFGYLFWRLPRVRISPPRVLRVALLAALLFEVLKLVGSVYVARTTSNPLYGAFAVVVGLLIWINIGSRLLLFCAAWAVTAPYDSDVAPSGTAGHGPAEPEREPAVPDVRTVRVPAVAPGASGERAVQAGQFTAGVLGVLVAAVVLGLLRTLRAALRR